MTAAPYIAENAQSACDKYPPATVLCLKTRVSSEHLQPRPRLLVHQAGVGRELNRDASYTLQHIRRLKTRPRPAHRPTSDYRRNVGERARFLERAVEGLGRGFSQSTDCFNGLIATEMSTLARARPP